jgi:hypothetical protein
VLPLKIIDISGGICNKKFGWTCSSGLAALPGAIGKRSFSYLYHRHVKFLHGCRPLLLEYSLRFENHNFLYDAWEKSICYAGCGIHSQLTGTESTCDANALCSRLKQANYGSSWGRMNFKLACCFLRLFYFLYFSSVLYVLFIILLALKFISSLVSSFTNFNGPLVSKAKYISLSSDVQMLCRGWVPALWSLSLVTRKFGNSSFEFKPLWKD